MRFPLRQLSQHQLDPDKQSTHPLSPNIFDGFRGLEAKILLGFELSYLRTIPLSEQLRATKCGQNQNQNQR